MNDLQRLPELFVKQLSKGPFPTDECANAKFDLATHGDLVIYLADIAGIASRGEGLKELDEATRTRFKTLAAKAWWDRHPETRASIDAQATPRLYELIAATEEARLMILDALHR